MASTGWTRNSEHESNIKGICFWTKQWFHTILVFQRGRRGDLMVSALDSGASGPGWSPGRGHCVVSFPKTLYSRSASLHRYHSLGDKLRPDGPLDSYANFTLPYLRYLKSTCWFQFLYICPSNSHLSGRHCFILLSFYLFELGFRWSWRVHENLKTRGL